VCVCLGFLCLEDFNLAGDACAVVTVRGGKVGDGAFLDEVLFVCVCMCWCGCVYVDVCVVGRKGREEGRKEGRETVVDVCVCVCVCMCVNWTTTYLGSDQVAGNVGGEAVPRPFVKHVAVEHAHLCVCVCACMRMCVCVCMEKTEVRWCVGLAFSNFLDGQCVCVCMYINLPV
jgi:hypothetical protein